MWPMANRICSMGHRMCHRMWSVGHKMCFAGSILRSTSHSMLYTCHRSCSMVMECVLWQMQGAQCATEYLRFAIEYVLYAIACVPSAVDRVLRATRRLRLAIEYVLLLFIECVVWVIQFVL